MLDLTLYRIGAPELREEDAFWIYTDLSKDDLALAIYALKERNYVVNAHNLILMIRAVGGNAEPLNEITMPAKDIDASLN